MAVGLVKSDLTQAVIDERLVEEAAALIWGLMSLSGRLLVELERATGKSVRSILQSAGQQAAGSEFP